MGVYYGILFVLFLNVACDGIYTVRPAVQKDYDTLITIVKETLSKNYATFEMQDYINSQLEKPDSWVSFYLDDPNYFLGVAVDEKNNIGGFIGAWRIRERYIYISPIMVNPVMQRQGIGALLISDLFKRFSWCDLLFLKVNIRNTLAYNFYKKQGFVELGLSVDETPVHKAEHVVMAKARNLWIKAWPLLWLIK